MPSSAEIEIERESRKHRAPSALCCKARKFSFIRSGMQASRRKCLLLPAKPPLASYCRKTPRLERETYFPSEHDLTTVARAIPYPNVATGSMIHLAQARE